MIPDFTIPQPLRHFDAIESRLGWNDVPERRVFRKTMWAEGKLVRLRRKLVHPKWSDPAFVNLAQVLVDAALVLEEGESPLPLVP